MPPDGFEERVGLLLDEDHAAVDGLQKRFVDHVVNLRSALVTTLVALAELLSLLWFFRATIPKGRENLKP